MKAKSMKMSVMTTAVIFLLAGASWADGGKNRHHRRVEKKHFQTEHNRKDGYREPSHDRQRTVHRAERHDFRHDREYHRAQKRVFKHHRKIHRRIENRSHYRHKDNYKHYHKHRPFHKVYSYRASAFDPGFSITIKTKNSW